MRNGCVGQTWPYTLKGFKRPNLVLGAHFEPSHFWRRREEKKGERELGFARDQVLVSFASHFLLLRDLTTWKRRFEEAKVRKTNPNLIFL